MIIVKKPNVPYQDKATSTPETYLANQSSKKKKC